MHRMDLRDYQLRLHNLNVFNTDRVFGRHRLATSCGATLRHTERSSHRSITELGSTKTIELKYPTSTLGSRNGRCVDSSQWHTSSCFSRSTAQFRTCSESHVIISRRSIIASSDSARSLIGKR